MPPKKSAGKGAAGAEETTGPDVGELRKAEFIRQSLQGNVASLKSRVRGLEVDNEGLRESQMRVSKETSDFVAYFRDELEQRDGAIEDLKRRLRESETARAREVSALTEEGRRAREEAEVREREARDRADKEIKELRDSLARLDEYRLNKTAVDAEVGALQKALLEEKVARRQEVQDVERKLLLRQAELEEGHRREYDVLRKRAHAEMQETLDADVKRLVVQNRRFAQELAFHREQNRTLAAEVATLRAACKEFAREIELAADAEKLYAERATHRKKENRGLRDKLLAAESAVADLARRRATASAGGGRGGGLGGLGGASEEREQEQAQVAEENEALRSLLLQKNRELRTVRRLAETILAQRSEVEQLVVDALTAVKTTVRDRRVALLGGGTGGAGAGATTVTAMSPSASAGASLRPPPSSPMRGSVRSLLQQAGKQALEQPEVVQAYRRLVQRAGAAGMDGTAAEWVPPLPQLTELAPEDREAVLETLFQALRAGRSAAPPRRIVSDDLHRLDAPLDGGIGAPFGLAVHAEARGHSPHTTSGAGGGGSGGGADSLLAALAAEAGLA